MQYSGALWGRKKKESKAGRRRPLAVVEPRDSRWSGRSCWGRRPPLQHRGNAPCKLSACGPPGEHCRGGRSPSCPQQSSLVCELGNDFGSSLQHVLLVSLAKLICVEGTCTGSRLLPPLPPVHVFTWCLWFVLHHLPPLLPLALKKQPKSFLLQIFCRDFHHFALAGSQDTP